MNLGKELTLATGCVVGLGIYENTKSATWLSQQSTPPYFSGGCKVEMERKPTENLLQDTKVIDSPVVPYLHPSYTSEAYLITHLARPGIAQEQK